MEKKFFVELFERNNLFLIIIIFNFCFYKFTKNVPHYVNFQLLNIFFADFEKPPHRNKKEKINCLYCTAAT